MQKRIAAIHDLSCFGKCSLSVVLPVLSCFGHECALLPTALLSGHFASLQEVSVLDLTEQMKQFSQDWETGGLTFDAVFSGYLASPEQAGLVKQFAETFRSPLIADPAMGDRGKLYRGFGPEQIQAMKDLCSAAEVVLPNVTEACLMLGKDYREQQSEDFLLELLQGMADLGPKQVVITGASLSEEQVGIACRENGDVRFFQRAKTPGHFNGTGDLFASVFTGALLKGRPFFTAAEQAMDFTAHVIAETAKNPHARTYGVDFEMHLKNLPL